MIEKLKLILASFLLMYSFACGGEPPPDIDGEALGTVEQAVYRPSGYGIEILGSGNICTGPWSGGECWVPDSKAFYTTFHANTCTPWWRERFVEIWNEMLAEVDYINDKLYDGAPLWWMGSSEGSGLPSGKIYQWSCSGSNVGALGSFEPITSNSDNIDAGGGNTLRQYKGGLVKMYTSVIESSTAWIAADDARRKRFARNVLRQEVWHQFGHGHELNGLMGGGDFWNNEYWPTTTMYDRTACYNPINGGLFADC